MKYQCECGHMFNSPMTITEHIGKVESILPSFGAINWMEETFQVCPECKSPKYEAIEDPQPTNVYIYDLTSGPQTKLDELLAEGYVIKQTYAKQYHLWKCPKVEAEKP